MVTRRDNGWERWRGQVDERLDVLVAGIARIEESVRTGVGAVADAQAAHQRSDDEHFAALRATTDDLDARWAGLRARVMVLSAGAGILMGALADVVARKLFG